MSMLRRVKPSSSSISSANSSEYDIETAQKPQQSKTMNASISSPPRSESMAYSVSPANDLWSKVMYNVMYNTKVFVGGMGLVLVVFVLILDGMDGGSSVGHGGLRL
jgi:hypothetical protein